MTTLTTPPRLDARMLTSRLIGSLFLAGFLMYGTGNALVTSVADGEDFLASVPAHATLLALGAFLMLLNTAVDIGKAVLFFPVVDQYGRKTALAYLAAMIIQVILMAAGALAVLLLIPLARESAAAGPAGDGWATALAHLALDANELGYQAGQLTLSVGAFVLVALLYRTRLVPRWLAGLGLVGYAAHAAGSAAEIFGVHISLVMLIPGALFEIGLAGRLLVKGFDPEAYEGPRRQAVTA
ncbi:hypothetical protein GCM10027059_20250 [Myceligenerans halotolerans]